MHCLKGPSGLLKKIRIQREIWSFLGLRRTVDHFPSQKSKPAQRLKFFLYPFAIDKQFYKPHKKQ